MRRVLVSVSDLQDEDLDRILARADKLSRERASIPSGPPRVIGLLFLETSLRTRVGFATAAARLGWSSVDIMELRQSPVSTVESFEHTLRTVSGYVDIVVVRPGRSLERGQLEEYLTCALINGGDRGAGAEHPTQALIDLYAIERARGQINGLHIGIVGDPGMRAVRSLLLLLSRRRPKWLSVYADASHEAEAAVPSALRAITDYRALPEVDDIDVLYVAGIPHESLPLADRERLLVAGPTMSRLPQDSIVLSPMPVIDEIGEAVQRDPRVRMFWQSDQGLFVRMAVLEAISRTVLESGG